MDLYGTWKQLELEKLSLPVPGQLRTRYTSKHPLQKLRWVYRATVGLITVFLLSFIFLFVLFEEPLVKGSLAFMMLFYFIGLILNLITYQKLKLNITLDQNIKSVLEHTYHSVSRNVQFQERLSLLIYPVAVICGFFLGVATMSDNFDLLIKGKSILIVLFVAVIIVTPLCHLLAKQLHKKAYGESLQELKRLIIELERPE